jgi:hypothetical protein
MKSCKICGGKFDDLAEPLVELCPNCARQMRARKEAAPTPEITSFSLEALAAQDLPTALDMFCDAGELLAEWCLRNGQSYVGVLLKSHTRKLTDELAHERAREALGRDPMVKHPAPCRAGNGGAAADSDRQPPESAPPADIGKEPDMTILRCDICGGRFTGEPTTDATAAQMILCPNCKKEHLSPLPFRDRRKGTGIVAETIPAMLANLARTTAEAAKVCEAQGHRVKAWELAKQAKVQREMALDQQAMEDGLRQYAAASKQIFGALLPKGVAHETH